MSCMFRKNDWVPAGAFVQLIAGDSPSPVATPGAAWLNFTGISPPSGNPATVSVIGGAAGAAAARLTARRLRRQGQRRQAAIDVTTNHHSVPA